MAPSPGEARLAILPGSPFARMARVLVAEWSLPVVEVEQEFPPPPDFFAENPLGQVPVLAIGEARVFPTLLVLERLWELAGAPASAYLPEAERQLLLVTLQAGDALTAALYQDWTGLRRVGPDHVGYDPGARNRLRVISTLAWLEEAAGTGQLRDGLTLPAVALACLVLWSETRGGPPWREHRRLGALVDALAARPSFTRTRPPSWSPD